MDDQASDWVPPGSKSLHPWLAQLLDAVGVAALTALVPSAVFILLLGCLQARTASSAVAGDVATLLFAILFITFCLQWAALRELPSASGSSAAAARRKRMPRWLQWLIRCSGLCVVSTMASCAVLRFTDHSMPWGLCALLLYCALLICGSVWMLVHARVNADDRA